MLFEVWVGKWVEYPKFFYPKLLHGVIIAAKIEKVGTQRVLSQQMHGNPTNLKHLKAQFPYFLLLFGMMAMGPKSLSAQAEFQGKDLATVEKYLRSFKNDSAIALTGQLLDGLKKRNQENSPFGIRVQLAEAIAFEHDQRGEEAIKKLIQVKQLSSEQHLWDVCAKACITLGLLYEKISLPKSSLEHLRDAQEYIQQFQLDTIYPQYTLRMASWHRFFGQRDSALYFTKQTIQTASEQQLYLEEAIGHMLMNLLLPTEALEERLQHSTKGLRLYEKIEDYTGCSFMYSAISSIHFQKNDLQQALLFNDSALISANRSIVEGNTEFHTLGSNYQFRGKIYKSLGQWDSAWSYLQKGYELELALKEKNINDKIVEVDARYNNGKKQQQIEAQNLELALKNNQLSYTLIISVLVSLIALGLFWALYKQRQARRELATQNTLIREQAEQLQSLDAAKTRFFANVSHELRTPLTLLTGPIQTLLTENQLTEKQTLLLQIAQRSGKQLGQLINEILDLRKLEMGRMNLLLEPTELRSWFHNCFSQFESLAEQKQLDYKIILDIPDRTMAELDREKCRQIVFNLLSNAFKFTPQGGHIEGRVAFLEHKLHLQIANSGSGIHPEDLPHVFDRYFQSNRPEKPVEGGTGIGLALCREYVQLFGGHISAESRPGADTIFRVTFPLALSNEAIKESTHQAEQHTENVSHPKVVIKPSDGTKTTKAVAKQANILVVEDNPDLCEYICLILKDKYHIQTAENGLEALKCMGLKLKEMGGASSLQTYCPPTPITPDLILSDLMMPVMDGYQLLGRLKSDDSTRHIPIVMLTARSELQDKLKALRIGVDDYLTKPFDDEELLLRIENLLKNQAMRQQETVVVPEQESTRPWMSQSDCQWLETFETYIQKHLSSDQLSVTALAHKFTMSESTLLRQLKRLTGLSPLQYLQEVRLNEARRLLESRSGYTIAQVASKVGYDDARAFARSFKQRYSKLPSELVAP